MTEIQQTVKLILNCIKAQIKELNQDKRIEMGKATQLKVLSLEIENKARSGII